MQIPSCISSYTTSWRFAITICNRITKSNKDGVYNWPKNSEEVRDSGRSAAYTLQSVTQVPLPLPSPHQLTRPAHSTILPHENLLLLVLSSLLRSSSLRLFLFMACRQEDGSTLYFSRELLVLLGECFRLTSLSLSREDECFPCWCIIKERRRSTSLPLLPCPLGQDVLVFGFGEKLRLSLVFLPKLCSL